MAKADIPITGALLNQIWKVGAKHALFRENGTWYHNLKDFPGALFDSNGYVIFESEKEYLKAPSIQIKQEVHISGGISSLPNYIRLTENDLRTVSQSLYRSSKKRTINKINPPHGQLDVKRIFVLSKRIIRDIEVSKWVKYVHDYICQICGTTLQLGDGVFYAEAHHIKPLGVTHNGSDVIENILCVCPNHHALLDYGAIVIKQNQLRLIKGHKLNPEYISYHNSVIFNSYNRLDLNKQHKLVE